jgi:hypothetical protein
MYKVAKGGAITINSYLNEKDRNIASESSMYLLHHVIQEVMGWKNYHLYQFTFDNLTIADK